ncbi:BrnT family toxin [Phreatobacter stygius]|uniref:BrnT family toxin n=1 Tax=Phreatobacter stygius TaxID=1940610 RepID=A0A4D7BAB9_9HYPH|nr:BrnT family toxin [Phreatobacter stygius]QCI65052.1 BrnT family toxin [Phreatobacter stygius]
MDFEWDNDKRLSNFNKHGIDFVDATAVLVTPSYTVRSKHLSEARWITIGELDGVLIAVIWTWRNETQRLISARRARPNERKDYARHIGTGSIG